MAAEPLPRLGSHWGRRQTAGSTPPSVPCIPEPAASSPRSRLREVQ